MFLTVCFGFGHIDQAATGLAGGMVKPLLLDGADEKAPREIAFQRDRYADEGEDHDHDQDRHIPPLWPTGRILRRDQKGKRLGVGRGKEKRYPENVLMYGFVERKSANRYSFQVRMSTNRKVAARPGFASGRTTERNMR